MIFQTTELLKVIEQCIEDGLGNKDVITLAGKIPHDEMIHWYNDADFIISSSHYEGSGTAVCEAMSCGCIPILTDIPSFRMMSDNGNCGLLYPPGDANALLSVLIKSTVIDITDSKRKILEQFNANLSFDAIAERFQDIALSL